MHSRTATTALAAFLVFAPNFAIGQAGSLDPAFGNGGIVVTNFGANINNFQLYDAALAPNGDILVAGTVSNLAEGEAQSCDIIRYLPNGSLDASFGSGGIVTLPAADFASISGVLSVQSNGQIVALTQAEVNNTLKIALIRLNTNGKLDATFGSGGQAIVNLPAPAGETASPSLVLAQPDGKILVAGAAVPPFRSKLIPQTVLGRFLSNGTLDATFGNGGFASAVAISIPTTVAVLAGDGILALNDFGQRAQFTSTGTLVTTPTVGIVTAVKSGAASTFQPNSDALIAGVVQGPYGRRNLDADIKRYLPSGVEDPAFASPALLFGPNGGEVASYSYGIGVDSLGRVIVGGQFATVGNSTWGVGRVDANGALDTAFGNGGGVNTLIGLGGFVNVILVQPNNDIVAVGEVQVSRDTDSTMEDLGLARYRAQ